MATVAAYSAGRRRRERRASAPPASSADMLALTELRDHLSREEIERLGRAIDGESGRMSPEDELLERQLGVQGVDRRHALIGRTDNIALTRQLIGVGQLGRG